MILGDAEGSGQVKWLGFFYFQGISEIIHVIKKSNWMNSIRRWEKQRLSAVNISVDCVTIFLSFATDTAKNKINAFIILYKQAMSKQNMC